MCPRALERADEYSWLKVIDDCGTKSYPDDMFAYVPPSPTTDPTTTAATDQSAGIVDTVASTITEPAGIVNTINVNGKIFPLAIAIAQPLPVELGTPYGEEQGGARGSEKSSSGNGAPAVSNGAPPRAALDMSEQGIVAVEEVSDDEEVPAPAPAISEYERKRLSTMVENAAKLTALGINPLGSGALTGGEKRARGKKRKARDEDGAGATVTSGDQLLDMQERDKLFNQNTVCDLQLPQHIQILRH